MRFAPPLLLAALLAPLVISPAAAQFGPAGPPSVGVLAVKKTAVTETQEFVGRIQATDKVDILARLTATLVERGFTEGAEVAQGDLLYRLDRAAFEADLASKQAAVAQVSALLKNAILATNRAQSLLNTPAGQRAHYDDTVAQQASLAAQLQAAQAQLKIAEISLGYTEIRAPVAGKIGRSALAVGNLATPTSGPLVSIVSQDPMYVLFPVPTRTVAELRNRYASRGGFAAVAIRLRLPDGQMHKLAGTIDYADPSVTAGTDTIMLRARMPNPLRSGARPGEPGNRDLIDGAFVGVLVEGVEPIQALAVPRAAVAQDQQGAYVYAVDAENKVAQRRVQLGAVNGAMVSINGGLQEGDSIVIEGLQRVRPGVVVAPSPAGAPAGAPPAKPAG
jgi:membrane fusion protein (multidrug efflux system)